MTPFLGDGEPQRSLRTVALNKVDCQSFNQVKVTPVKLEVEPWRYRAPHDYNTILLLFLNW